MRLQCDCRRMKRGNRLIHCRQVKSSACPSRNHVRHQQTQQTLCKCSLFRIPPVCEIRLANFTKIHLAITLSDNSLSSASTGRISESAIDMLAHLFPHRKRSVLDLILRRCDLDLLKAIEQCRPTPSAFKPISIQVQLLNRTTHTIFEFEISLPKCVAEDGFIAAKVHDSSSSSRDRSDSHDFYIAVCTNACRLSEMGISNVSDSRASFGQLSVQMHFHQLSDVRVPNRKVLKIKQFGYS